MLKVKSSVVVFLTGLFEHFIILAFDRMGSSITYILGPSGICHFALTRPADSTFIEQASMRSMLIFSRLLLASSFLPCAIRYLCTAVDVQSRQVSRPAYHHSPSARRRPRPGYLRSTECSLFTGWPTNPVQILMCLSAAVLQELLGTAVLAQSWSASPTPYGLRGSLLSTLGIPSTLNPDHPLTGPKKRLTAGCKCLSYALARTGPI